MLNFPALPSTGDLYSLGDRAWRYNGRGWTAYPGVVQGIADLYVTGDINSIEGDVNISGSFNVPGDLNVNAGNFNLFGNINASAGDFSLSGNINVLGQDLNIYGNLVIQGEESNALSVTFQQQTLTSNRTITIPNQTGTMALVSGTSFINTGLQRTTTGTTTGFTAGSGTTVVSGSTFTGNLDGAAYTIGDVVRALKELGLLQS